LISITFILHRIATNRWNFLTGKDHRIILSSYLAWSCCWSGGGGGRGATCSPRGWGGGGGGGPRGPQRWGGGSGGCGAPPILQSLSLYAMQCEIVHSYFKLENLKFSLNLSRIKCWNFYFNGTQKTILMLHLLMLKPAKCFSLIILAHIKYIGNVHKVRYVYLAINKNATLKNTVNCHLPNLVFVGCCFLLHNGGFCKGCITKRI
jgi:hypothetical protein